MLLEMRFATDDITLFAQQFACRQGKQTVNSVPQDLVRIIVNAGITVFYFHKSQT